MAWPKHKNSHWKATLIPPDVPNIFSAAENDDVNALEIALDFYDVNEPDAIGMRPLHYAASTLSARTRDKLLNHPDIDPTLADDFGRSASTVAIECWGALADNFVNKLNPYCYPWLYEEFIP